METPLLHQSGEGIIELFPMKDTTCTICTAGSWGLEDHNGVSINIRLVKYGVCPFFLFKYQKHYSLVIEKNVIFIFLF